MPEIDNSLAASVKPLDIAGALAKAAQIREATASADLKQQALQHNEREYGENAGLTAGERATMSKTQQEAMGPIGNILANDQSPQARQQAISLARRAGIPMDDMTAGHLMSAPPDQIKQYGINAQRLGQSSSTNIEQSGVPAGNSAREAGKYLPEGLQPNVPYTSRTAAATGGPSQAKVDNAVKTGRNFDGSPRVLSTADVVGVETPNQTVNNRFPNQSVFQPRVVRNPDGTISSSVTPETQGLQGSAVDRFKQMQDTAGRAQGLMGQLDAIEHDNEILNSSGWSSTGTGANAKLGAAKSINSLFTSVGMQPPIDPTKVGSWEGYNKQTIRAGFELARTLGGHQAESVVHSSVNATPNVENTYFGSKVITNSIRQTVQREIDMYRYSLEYAKRTGSTFGAEDEFNQKFPPKLYSQTAVANAIPDTSIKRLTSTGDQKNKDMFDATYGKGMADFILKQAR